MTGARGAVVEPRAVRRFRIEDSLWYAAMDKARAEGTTISAKLRGWIIEDLRKGQDTAR